MSPEKETEMNMQGTDREEAGSAPHLPRVRATPQRAHVFQRLVFISERMHKGHQAHEGSWKVTERQRDKKRVERNLA